MKTVRAGQEQLPTEDEDAEPSPGSRFDFLVHARPRYQVRTHLQSLDRLAREALQPRMAEALPGHAELAAQWRDDFAERVTEAGFGMQMTEGGDIAEDQHD